MNHNHAHKLSRCGKPTAKQATTDSRALAKARRAFLRLGRRTLLEAAMFVGEATIDDVRDYHKVPAGMSPSLFGAMPAELVRAGIIHRIDDTASCRPSARGRRVAVWAVIDRAAAKRWLRTHPAFASAKTHANRPIAAASAAATKEETQ